MLIIIIMIISSSIIIIIIKNNCICNHILNYDMWSAVPYPESAVRILYIILLYFSIKSSVPKNRFGINVIIWICNQDLEYFHRIFDAIWYMLITSI